MGTTADQKPRPRRPSRIAIRPNSGEQAPSKKRPAVSRGARYVLEEQIGFLLRRAHQRASGLFESVIPPQAVSPLQLAALVKLRDEGAVSQNHLGRLTYMDPATVMGVIQRLEANGLVERTPHVQDKRRTMVALTPEGLRLMNALASDARRITQLTLAPLTRPEQKRFLQLLKKLT